MQLTNTGLNNRTDNSNTSEVYKCITYNRNIAHKITKTLRKVGIILTHKSKSISNILNNAKSNTNKLEKSGVYQIQCDQCRTSYIGQTQRALKQRLKEHLRINNDNSSFAQHLREYKHSCTKNKKIMCVPMTHTSSETSTDKWNIRGAFSPHYL